MQNENNTPANQPFDPSSRPTRLTIQPLNDLSEYKPQAADSTPTVMVPGAQTPSSTPAPVTPEAPVPVSPTRKPFDPASIYPTVAPHTQEAIQSPSQDTEKNPFAGSRISEIIPSLRILAFIFLAIGAYEIYFLYGPTKSSIRTAPLVSVVSLAHIYFLL